MTQRLATLLAGVAAALLLIAAIGLVQDRMSAMRSRYQLADETILQDAPPAVAFVTVALGGFRGILADLLFLRCQQLHEQENYFEHVQLADWLVKLQPNFTGATSYLAWNMAYNVSVTFTDPKDRWRWVQRGIELIRDEALRYHTSDPKLYWQLGWIFQHKMGDILDDANWYYKSQFALQVMETIGSRDANYDWQALANAPSNWRELREALGPAEAEKLDALLRARDLTMDRLEFEFRSKREMPTEMAEAMAPFPWKTTVELTLRRRWLKDRLSLEPAAIVAINEKYGHLDFRLPEANAIYWATMGLRATPDGVNIECERMIFQNMSDSFRRGRLLYITNEGIPFLGCNPAVVDAVASAYLSAAANNPTNSSVMSGYENFMKDAIVLLYAEGYRKKSEEVLIKLRSHPRFAENSEYRRSVDDLALDLMAGDIAAMSTDQARSLVASLMHRSNTLLAVGDEEQGSTLRWIAERIFVRFSATITDETISKRKGIAPDWPTVVKITTKQSIMSFHPELRDAFLARLKADGVDTNKLLEEIRDEAERFQKMQEQMQRN